MQARSRLSQYEIEARRQRTLQRSQLQRQAQDRRNNQLAPRILDLPQDLFDRLTRRLQITHYIQSRQRAAKTILAAFFRSVVRLTNNRTMHRGRSWSHGRSVSAESDFDRYYTNHETWLNRYGSTLTEWGWWYGSPEQEDAYVPRRRPDGRWYRPTWAATRIQKVFRRWRNRQ